MQCRSLPAYQPKSPCPTLKVVGAATSVLGKLEENARMKASRQGKSAKVVANHELPKEERKAHLEKMLQALDKTPDDPEQLEKDRIRTSGMSPVLDEVVSRHTELNPAREETHHETGQDVLSFAGAVAEFPDIHDPALDVEKEKEPPKMIPGHELLGDTPVVFHPQNVMTMARAGQPLSEVATQADVFIRYKCRKGKCKTCAVNIDGKWVSACQTKIPHRAPNQPFEIRVREVAANKQENEKKAAFFSPKSMYDGFLNNAIGMVGFAKEGVAANPDFIARMEKEKRIEELTAKAKARKNSQGYASKASLRGTNANPNTLSHEAPAEEQEGSGVEFLVPGLVAATAGMMLPFIGS